MQARGRPMLLLLFATLTATTLAVVAGVARTPARAVTVSQAVKHDLSPALSALASTVAVRPGAAAPDCGATRGRCGTAPPLSNGNLSPGETDGERRENGEVREHAVRPPGPQAAAVEQRAQGARPPILMLESFDGHGAGLVGPHGVGRGNNPSDNSLAVGPNHIVETVNSLTAVYTKKGDLFDTTGRVLFGPMGHNVIWNGFGGECERTPNGDTVVRYDQLADRWLIVMPRFNRAPLPAGSPPGTQGPYGMCYAVSTGPNPLGPYHRYYFERELFPDYPRPAIWPDGYYIPTSTGDNLLPDGRLPEKHACVVEREKLLAGLPATEQCVIIPESNFLNNADIDGKGVPPAGAPNIMLASGGTQLRQIFQDDGIYVYKFHVDWVNPSITRVDGPTKITVAPYNYLCDGQLTRCVPQRGSENRLDAQGDKIMQRLVYRNINGQESIVAVHSVNTAAGGGGVRWYEFRFSESRELVLHQQGTYAPDSNFRWMASPGFDRQGNIAFGYSFGGREHFPGQRFVARLASDPPGIMSFRETVLIEGQAAQQGTNLRWQDYTTTAMDPVDDCTFWYQGDYYKANSTTYRVRIGSFRVPGCLRGTISGSVFYDPNRNGMREPNEIGLEGWRVSYIGATVARGVTGTRAVPVDSAMAPPRGTLTTNSAGEFQTSLAADPAYFEPHYAVTAQAVTNSAWSAVAGGTGYWSGGTLRKSAGSYSFRLQDRDDVTRLDFGFVCLVANNGGTPASFWLAAAGRALLASNDPPPAADSGRSARGGGRGARGRGRGGPQGWRPLLNNTRFLVNQDGSRFTVPVALSLDSTLTVLQSWLSRPGSNPAHGLSLELAAASLNAAFGNQAGNSMVNDPVGNEWIPVNTLLARISMFLSENPNLRQGNAARAAAASYRTVLAGLNNNSTLVIPATPSQCPAR